MFVRRSELAVPQTLLLSSTPEAGSKNGASRRRKARNYHHQQQQQQPDAAASAPSTTTTTTAAAMSLATEGLEPHEVARLLLQAPPATAREPQQRRPDRRPPSSGCGCLVPLSAAVASSECPRCGAPVGSVCDGVAGALLLRQPRGEEGPPPTADDDLGRGRWRIVAFRHQSRVYCLGVQPTRDDGSSAANRAPVGTAQGRIAAVLGLDPAEMKILAQGKVLYPSSTLTDEQVSERLLALSSVPATTAQSRKTALLVLGTRHVTTSPRTARSSSTPLCLLSRAWTVGCFWGLAAGRVAVTSGTCLLQWLVGRLGATARALQLALTAPTPPPSPSLPQPPPPSLHGESRLRRRAP